MNKIYGSLICLFCLLGNLSYSHTLYLVNPLKDTSITVKKISTNEKTIKGKIAGTYAITIYLKFVRFSDASSAVYSVNGYYYYDKIKKEIPLVGIYDYNAGLILYQFDSKEKQDTLLNFLLSGSEGGFYDELDKYEGMSGFTEKLVIESQTKGTWQRGSTMEKLTLTADNLNVYTEQEYMYIRTALSEKVIDLGKIDISERNFELINFNKQVNQTKVLLRYQYLSKAYHMGMCGAGEEIGYVILYLNKENVLIKKEVLAIASCLGQIDYEETKTTNPAERKFSINDYKKISTVILNEKDISFKKTDK